jgi:hypothetical protein
MRALRVGSAAVFAVCFVWASDAAARDYYGAIAYSNTTGAYGYSYDYASRGQAEERSMAECTKRGSGCKVVLWFRNACGALATGRNFGYGFAWATTRGESEQVALRYCGKYTSECKVAAWVCTTR